MKKKMLNVLAIISVVVLMPVATYLSLYLNMLNRVAVHDFASAIEGYVLVTQTFLLNNFIYLVSLFITLCIFYIKEARANIKLLIVLAAATVVLAIPQLTWAIWSNVNADTLVFRLLFWIFYDIERTLMLFSINFIVYVLLIIRELGKRKTMK